RPDGRAAEPRPGLRHGPARRTDLGLDPGSVDHRDPRPGPPARPERALPDRDAGADPGPHGEPHRAARGPLPRALLPRGDRAGFVPKVLARPDALVRGRAHQPGADELLMKPTTRPLRPSPPEK